MKKTFILIFSLCYFLSFSQQKELILNNGSAVKIGGLTYPNGVTGTTGQTLRYNGASWIANDFIFNNGTSNVSIKYISEN